MSDVLAARYCDYSLSQFQAMVRAGKIEAGRTVPGTVMVRWHRSALDRHLAEIHDIIDSGGEPGAASNAEAEEWLKSLADEGGNRVSEQDPGQRPGLLVLPAQRRKRPAGRGAG
jgi:hypothetical protein